MASTVVDASGEPLGTVQDLRLVEHEPGSGRPRFEVAGVVIGRGALARFAHGWGFAEGRARGPWLLRVLTAGAVRRSRFVPAEHVVDWGPGQVRIGGHESDLTPLSAARDR